MCLRRLTDASEPEALAALYERDREVHARDTRSSSQYRPPRIRNEFGRKRFAYRAVTLYNSLPPDVSNARESRTAFRKSLQQHMLNPG